MRNVQWELVAFQFEQSSLSQGLAWQSGNGGLAKSDTLLEERH